MPSKIVDTELGISIEVSEINDSTVEISVLDKHTNKEILREFVGRATDLYSEQKSTTS